MFRRKTSFIVGTLLAVAILVQGQIARAVTLVPPSLEFSVQKGETVKTEVKLYNETSEALTLFPSTANFTAKDEDGTPNFDPDSKQVDLASWISVDKPSYSLASNERITVPVTIKIPANADPGGHYAALFFGNAPAATAGSGVAIQSKIGTLVILRVEGQINEAASVTSLTIKGGKRTLTSPPVTIEALIANQGNVHVRPEGTIIIRNMFGGQTASLVFNSVRGAILPNSSRHFDVTWQKGTPDDQRSGFFHQVGNEWHNFALGTYTASLSATYGANQQALSTDVRFTIFPWELLLVIVILLVIIIVGLTLGIRRYNAMIINRAERGPGKT